MRRIIVAKEQVIVYLINYLVYFFLSRIEKLKTVSDQKPWLFKA